MSEFLCPAAFRCNQCLVYKPEGPNTVFDTVNEALRHLVEFHPNRAVLLMEGSVFDADEGIVGAEWCLQQALRDRNADGEHK